MTRFGASLLCLAAATLVSAAAPDPSASPLPARFATEIAAFADSNARAGETHGGTLFLGSSSVRLWSVVDDLPAAGSINRGFGGATVAEVLRYYPTLIGRADPETVIVYVGENDISEGRAPDAVTADVLTLLARLRADLPRARIAYLSMKPSPRRWALWPKLSAINAVVSAHAGAFDYLDVSRSLIGPDGNPDPAFFGADGLHMNPQGYGRWNTIVAGYLHRPMSDPKLAAAGATTL